MPALAERKISQPFMLVSRETGMQNVRLDKGMDQVRPFSVNGEPYSIVIFHSPKIGRAHPERAMSWDVVSKNGERGLKRHEVPFHEQPKGRLAKTPRNTPNKYK